MGNVFLEYGRRTVYVLYYALRFCGIMGIPMLILLWLNRKRGAFTIRRLVCALAALLAILALIGSPEVSDRTYLGPSFPVCGGGPSRAAGKEGTAFHVGGPAGAVTGAVYPGGT